MENRPDLLDLKIELFLTRRDLREPLTRFIRKLCEAYIAQRDDDEFAKDMLNLN